MSRILFALTLAVCFSTSVHMLSRSDFTGALHLSERKRDAKAELQMSLSFLIYKHQHQRLPRASGGQSNVSSLLCCISLPLQVSSDLWGCNSYPLVFDMLLRLLPPPTDRQSSWLFLSWILGLHVCARLNSVYSIVRFYNLHGSPNTAWPHICLTS